MDIERFRNMDPNDVCKALIAEGYKYVGNGMSTYVFIKPYGRKVIKIVCGDKGQKTAIDMFAKNQDNPEFPKLYGYVNLRGPYCFLVVMEKLKPQNGGWFDKKTGLGSFRHQTSELVQKYARKIGAGTDLHGANIMLRNNGEAVIVDPFHVSRNGNLVRKLKTTALAA